MKHLRVLEEAGLVTTRRSGCGKLPYLNPVQIRLVHGVGWMLVLSGMKTRPGNGSSLADRDHPDCGAGRPALASLPYLTEPSVSPPRQYRCNTIMAIASGITDNRTPPVVSW